MSDITIRTNGHVRELRAYHELPDAARAEWFDHYMGTLDETADEHYMPRFFRYRGAWYDVNDGFDHVTSATFAGWDGAQSDSVFSGTVIRYANDGAGRVDYGAVIVGRYWQ